MVFTVKAVKYWISLPREVLEPSSLQIFKPNGHVPEQLAPAEELDLRPSEVPANHRDSVQLLTEPSQEHSLSWLPIIGALYLKSGTWSLFCA